MIFCCVENALKHINLDKPDLIGEFVALVLLQQTVQGSHVRCIVRIFLRCCIILQVLQCGIQGCLFVLILFVKRPQLVVQTIYNSGCCCVVLLKSGEGLYSSVSQQIEKAGAQLRGVFTRLKDLPVVLCRFLLQYFGRSK